MNSQDASSKRTAKAVIVFRVFGLISAGMNARMKLGTLRSCPARQDFLAGRPLGVGTHELM